MLKILTPIFIIGILIRSYFVFFKGTNIDEFTSIGFAADPSWQSLFWDNHPPLFYLIGKLLLSMGTDPELTLKYLILGINGLSLFLYALIFGKKSPFVFFLLAIAPVSLANSTLIRPTALIELLALTTLYFFIKIFQKKESNKLSKGALIFSFLLLCLTTYTAVLLLGLLTLYAFVQFKWRPQRKQVWGLLALAILSSFLLSEIRWGSLQWFTNKTEWLDSMNASLLWLRNMFGYSWVSLGVFGYLISSRKLWFLGVFLFAVISINPLLSIQAMEPRFLMTIIPSIYFIVFDETLSRLSLVKKRILGGVLLTMFLWLSAWFTITNKSKLEESIQWVLNKNIQNVDFHFSASAVRVLSFKYPSLQGKTGGNDCGYLKAVVKPTHAPDFTQVSEKIQAGLYNFELIEKKEFPGESLEKVVVWIGKSTCPY
jgi:hypothetical protein